MTVGFAFDQRFLDHDTGRGHPERPARPRAIVDRLEADGWRSRMVELAFEALPEDEIARLHAPAYIRRLRLACERGEPFIDVPDSRICPDSYEIARLAAGAAVSAADAVVAGELDRAFCGLRPPGHHAEIDRSMGFCLFNNAALAARRLVEDHGLARVAIVDFDVHHGNGTQHLFEDRADVLFVSVHQDPATLYPGSGFARETGTGAGEGFTLNVPLAPGGGDEAYRRAFEAQVLPKVAGFEPEALVVSAGFDAAAADPLAGMNVSRAGFRWIADRLVAIADEASEGRLIACLEGGYDLKALADGVAELVEGMVEGS